MSRSFDGFLSAVSAFLGHAGTVDVWFLLAALPLQVANLLIRSFAWRSLLSAAFPASTVRLRDVFGATTAGDAINVVAPARVGDLATIALAHAEIEGSNVPAVTSSLVLLGAFDFVVSLAMYAWVYTLGVFPSLPDLPRAPTFEWSLFASNWWPFLAAGAVVVVGFLILRAWVTREIQGLLRRTEEGFAMLHHPGRYVRAVAFPPAIAFALRIGVVMLTLRAFHLQSNLRTALIVTAVGEHHHDRTAHPERRRRSTGHARLRATSHRVRSQRAHVLDWPAGIREPDQRCRRSRLAGVHAAHTPPLPHPRGNSSRGLSRCRRRHAANG